jgi:hypothetical protein
MRSSAERETLGRRGLRLFRRRWRSADGAAGAITRRRQRNRLRHYGARTRSEDRSSMAETARLALHAARKRAGAEARHRQRGAGACSTRFAARRASSAGRSPTPPPVCGGRRSLHRAGRRGRRLARVSTVGSSPSSTAVGSTAAPEPGRRVFVADEGAEAVFDGVEWLRGVGAGGAATVSHTIVFDHALQAGALSLTAAVIPDKAVVLGVTGRVLASLGDGVAFRLGVPGAPDRYGYGWWQ